MPGLLRSRVPDNDLLSRARLRTIIGVLPFHGPVRDGKGWFQQAMVVRRWRATAVGGNGEHRRRGARWPRGGRGCAVLRLVGPLSGRQAGVESCLAHTPRISGTVRVAGSLIFETHNDGVKPHGPLVPVSSTRYRASTPGLSTWWSATTLQGGQASGRSHLQARFPLRCFQRLSLPYIATRRCDWRHNRYTSGTSTPVLSY